MSDIIDRRKRHYLRNRDRILKLLRTKRKHERRIIEKKLAKRNAFAVFFERMMQRLSALSEHTERVLLALLVISCTGFLISESTRTLSVLEGEGALAKAILCEVVLVGISFLHASTRMTRVLRPLALAGISILVLLNTLGAPLARFSEEVRGAGARAQEITILGESIAQKKVLLDRYVETNRISGARKIQIEISSLSDRLAQLSREQGQEKSKWILVFGLAITVLFRLVIMCANIVFANELGLAFRRTSVVTRPNIVLMRPEFGHV